MIKEIASRAKHRMAKTVEDLRRELTTIRTGRASVHLLDHLTVDYYGTSTPFNQLATLHVPEPSLITVQPWDVSQIGSIEKAILASDLGLNPSSDGKIVRIPIPPLTEERRQVLAKHVGKVTEEHRAAVRNIRRDANDGLKKLLKEKEISEDMEYDGLEQVQKFTDDHIKQVDELVALKEKEIVEV